MKNTIDIRVFKIISWILLGLVCLAAGLYFFAEFTGSDLVLPWQVKVTYFPKPLFIEYFQARGESIGFYVDQYINWQQYSVGNMRFMAWPTWALFIAVILCFWLISTAVTYFKRFWYLITLGILILLLLQLNLTELLLWGDYGNYLALALLITSTYYFHAIKPEASLTVRLAVIGLIIAIYMILVSLFGETSMNGLTTISYGLHVPIILALLFMVFVAGENIFTILKVTTSKGGNGRNNLFHFITFGIIYNGILILLFLHKRGEIDFELSFISPYVILVVSAISAYFSFDLRLEKQKGTVPISILKQWVYPAMFVCTFSLLAFAELTANDPLIEGLEYGIIISHLAIGSAYFVASFVNFTPFILQNLNVHKVYYKPTMAPIFLINLASLAGMVALIFFVNLYPYYQIKAGLYNTLGDISEYKKEVLLAEQYYKQGVGIDFVNFKSNFQVAKYEKEKGNAVGVIQNMQNTFFKNGSGKGYTMLSNYYNSKNQQFNTLFTLKEAKQKFENREVNNNLAFTYRQFTTYDSAFLLLQHNWDEHKDPLAKSNLLALSTELPNITEPDSVILALSANNIRTKSNAIALANLNNSEIAFQIKMAPDTFLLQDDLFYLFNASLNFTTDPDSSKIEVIDYYLSNPYNGALKSFLLKAKAIQLYELGQVNQAFQQLELLRVIDNQQSASYNFILGVWSLHQNQRLLSNDYFDLAAGQGFDQNQITKIQNAVLTSEIPIYKSRVQANFENISPDLDSIPLINQLKTIAQANAFDEPTTLAAIEQLRSLNISQQDIYSLFVEAHKINKYSVPVFQGYILSAIDAGLSKFALDGLKELALLMPAVAFENFDKFVNDQIEIRRNQLF